MSKFNKYLIIGMACAIIVLMLSLVFTLFRKTPETFSLEYEQSKMREEVLQGKVQALALELLAIRKVQDSLSGVITEKNQDIIAITKKYRYEKDRVRNLPLDDGVEFLSGWLSESDSI